MKETKICVIGLGYVGLPLARLFSTKYKTVGFDMNTKRCEALMAGHDATLEVSDELLQDALNTATMLHATEISEKLKALPPEGQRKVMNVLDTLIAELQ